MSVSIAIVGSRGVFPAVSEIDLAVARLPLPWPDGLSEPSDTVVAERILIFRQMFSEDIDGGADGGDYAGRLWAEAHGIPVHDEPITGEDIQRYGKYIAPKHRNRRVSERAAIAVAFWDGLSSGTPDFCTRMQLRKKYVEVVPSKIVKGRPRRPRLGRRYPAGT